MKFPILETCKTLLLAYGTQFVIRKGNLFVFYGGILRATVRSLPATFMIHLLCINGVFP